MEAGFDSEKAVLNMTMDDVLSLPGITVAEIGMINEIQKAVKAGKFITFLGRRGDMSSEKVIWSLQTAGGTRFFHFRTVLFCVWSMGTGTAPVRSAVTTARNR